MNNCGQEAGRNYLANQNPDPSMHYNLSQKTYSPSSFIQTDIGNKQNPFIIYFF